MRESIISKKTNFKGIINETMPLRIFGYVDGKIISDNTVTIEKGGYVKGYIHAKDLFINGCFDGNANVFGRARFFSEGSFKGTLLTRFISIEEGCQFDGTGKVTYEEGRDLPELSAISERISPSDDSAQIKNAGGTDTTSIRSTKSKKIGLSREGKKDLSKQTSKLDASSQRKMVEKISDKLKAYVSVHDNGNIAESTTVNLYDFKININNEKFDTRLDFSSDNEEPFFEVSYISTITTKNINGFHPEKKVNFKVMQNIINCITEQYFSEKLMNDFLTDKKYDDAPEEFISENSIIEKIYFGDSDVDMYYCVQKNLSKDNQFDIKFTISGNI